MIEHGVVVAGLLVCAVQAVRAQRLLLSALWLAGTSALVALEMYLLGAPEVAVIELSVGAGLVTVLFVFAINIAGEEDIPVQPVVPKPLAWVMVVASVLLLIWMNSSVLTWQVQLEKVMQLDFKNVLWGDRLLDVMLQVALIFCGVLGVLGLLAEGKDGKHAGHEAAAVEHAGEADLMHLPIPLDDQELTLEPAGDGARKENA